MEGDTASMLLQASERGDLGKARLLVSTLKSSKAFIEIDDLVDPDGRTALHKASAYGNLLLVKELLKVMKDPLKTCKMGRTALHEACIGGHPNIVAELVKYVGNMTLQDAKLQTPVHMAAYHGEAKSLRMLLKSSFDADAKDYQGNTAMHLASEKGCSETLSCLIGYAKDTDLPNKNGFTPMQTAAMHGSLACIQILQKSKISVDQCLEDNRSLSHLAVDGDHLDCLKYLLTECGETLKIDNQGQTVMHVAGRKGANLCLHFLLERRFDCNLQDAYGFTPTHYAAKGGHTECLNCLMVHEADKTVTNNRGETPLDTARRFGKPNCYDAAEENRVRCVRCKAKEESLLFLELHKPSPIEQSISRQEYEIFHATKAVGSLMAKRKESAAKGKTSPIGQGKQKSASVGKNRLPKRDLASKYYGEEIFVVPESIRAGKSLKS